MEVVKIILFFIGVFGLGAISFVAVLYVCYRFKWWMVSLHSDRDLEKKASEVLEEDLRANRVFIRKNVPKLIAKLRARIKSLPANQEARPKTFPSPQCMLGGDIPHITYLIHAGASSDFLDNLPHIKECPYCISLLRTESPSSFPAGFWEEVFRKEGAGDVSPEKLEGSP